MAQLEFNCFYCRKLMREPGAILFGPPLETHERDVTITDKRHVCVDCWPSVRDLQAILTSAEQALKWYAGHLRPEDRLDDNGDKALVALTTMRHFQRDE